MGGREAIRGFAIQTLICLLDSLTSQSDWTSVTLEPDSSNDKVDICWIFGNGQRLVQQVKSSKNQIGKADVVRWCNELEASGGGTRYELLLAGPVAAAVLEEEPFGEVSVPTPTSIDTLALTDQATTKLDRYLYTRGMGSVPLPLRESIVHELVGRMLKLSTQGTPMTREAFDGWLLRGVLASYPDAVNQRLETNSVLLWSVMELVCAPDLSRKAFDLVLPITVVNGGALTTVVESFVLRLASRVHEMRYLPAAVLSEAGTRSSDWRPRSSPFAEFAVSPQQSLEQKLLFVPLERPQYHTGQWAQGEYEVELYVKYQPLDSLVLAKKLQVVVGPEEFSVLTSQRNSFIRISDPDRIADLL